MCTWSHAAGCQWHVAEPFWMFAPRWSYKSQGWSIYYFIGRLLEYIYKFLLVFSHENKFFATRDFRSWSFGKWVFFLLKPRAALASRCVTAAFLLSRCFGGHRLKIVTVSFEIFFFSMLRQNLQVKQSGWHWPLNAFWDDWKTTVKRNQRPHSKSPGMPVSLLGMIWVHRIWRMWQLWAMCAWAILAVFVTGQLGSVWHCCVLTLRPL